MDNILNTLFPTPTLTVLHILLQNSDLELNDTEIAKLCTTIKKSAVNNSLRELASIGIVERKPRGRMVFNKLIESPLVTKFKIVSNILSIQNLIDDLMEYCSKVILFGSRADGTNVSESDFDLFVVTSKERAVRKIIKESYLFESIQIVIRSPEETLTFQKKEKVLYEQIKKGIVWEKK